MTFSFSAVVLANTNSEILGVKNRDGILANESISRAVVYSSAATRIIIGVNFSLNDNVTSTQVLDEVLIKYLPSTRGALASLGLLLDLVPEDLPVLIVPINSWIEESLEDFVGSMISDNADVGLVVVKSNSPDLSYVRYVGEKIVEIHEKEVVSEYAISGHFFFRNKKVILDCLDWAMLNNINKDGLLYIAPSLNFSITKGMKVSSFRADHEKYTHLRQTKGVTYGV